MKRILKTSIAAGLAAPQMGISLRFFLTKGLHGTPRLAINPKIIWRSFSCTSALEGCMSFEDGRRKIYVKRPDQIRAEWMNHSGIRCEARFFGFAARLFQHETDHLDGICIFP
jgi:peptide deformylase